MSTFDFRSATRATADLVAGVRDDQLGEPTPCPAYTVADLVDHVHGLSFAFTASARKERLEDASASADGGRLPADWREVVPAALAGLAEAWHGTPDAYDGMTQAGPIDLPARRGPGRPQRGRRPRRDLAVATGQEYDVDPASVAAAARSSSPSSSRRRSRRRRRPVRPARHGPYRRRGPRPAGRCHRPPPRLDPLRHARDFGRPSRSGNLPGGGVSERPKENASKAFVGASPPRVKSLRHRQSRPRPDLSGRGLALVVDQSGRPRSRTDRQVTQPSSFSNSEMSTSRPAARDPRAARRSPGRRSTSAPCRRRAARRGRRAPPGRRGTRRPRPRGRRPGARSRSRCRRGGR